MEIEAGLYSFLTGEDGVGGLVDTRIYPLTIPQDVSLPAIAYQRVSRTGVLAHSGQTGLAEARIQITCQAAGYDTVKDLARAVRLALDGWQGTMGGTGGVEVHEARVVNELDGYGMVAGIYTVRLDVMLWYTEIDGLRDENGLWILDENGVIISSD